MIERLVCHLISIIIKLVSSSAAIYSQSASFSVDIQCETLQKI